MSFKILWLLLILSVSFAFTSCCSCGGEDNIVKGILTIVGNEPFTNIAIKLDDDKNYVLECKEELKRELIKQQGRYYAIEFYESKVEDGIPILVVKKATPLNQNTN